MDGRRERVVRIAAGTVLSVLYWLLAVVLLLSTQMGDPPPALQTPEGFSVVHATKVRMGLIVLFVEVVVYATLFLLIRRVGRPSRNKR